MLYREYNDPTNLFNRYADSNRLNELVLMILESKERRDKEKAELIIDDRLWLAFIFAQSDKTFAEFKADVLKQNTENESVFADNDSKFGKEEQEQLLQSLFPAYYGAG